MNCPRLPAVPDRRISQIDPSWFRTLNECLLYAMTHPMGDGSTVFNDAGGTLRTGITGDGDGSALESENGGPFAVEIYNAGDDDSPKWKVKLFNSKSESGNAGMVTIGSYREMIEDREWDAQEGTVYLDVTYDPETEEYDVIFDLEEELPDTGDEQRYILRIAEITYDVESETWAAHQIRDYGDIEITGRWVQ